MSKHGERCILVVEKASAIRDTLSMIMARVKSEGDLSLGSRERLEGLAGRRCDRLILDLRAVKEPPVGIDPGIQNIRANYLGQVLVVSGEVTAPGLFQEIESLHPPHFSLGHFGSSLLAFVHTLFFKYHGRSMRT